MQNGLYIKSKEAFKNYGKMQLNPYDLAGFWLLGSYYSLNYSPPLCRNRNKRGCCTKIFLIFNATAFFCIFFLHKYIVVRG